MRTKKEISETLKDLEEIWAQHPELRLGQLILNLPYDFYSLEDEEFLYLLKLFYNLEDS